MIKSIKNNKGYMLVEIIIASVIAFVMAYFLIDITIKLVNNNNDYYVESILLADKNIITKEIMDDINSKKLVNVELLDEIEENGYKYYSRVILSFDDGTNKDLIVSKNDSTITYGNYKKKLSDKLNVAGITISNSNNMLSLSIPAYTNYSDNDYGINLVVPYSEDIEIVLPDLRTEYYATEEIEYELTESGVTELTLNAGVYKLEVWGAQGGYQNDSSKGGKGGYSYGTLTLTEPTKIYVYVGGSGNSGGSAGGFNGGGKRDTYPGGGGASDVRIGTDSLYSRVIVAGGGGSEGDENIAGGYGGGTYGGDATSGVDSGGGYGGEIDCNTTICGERETLNGFNETRSFPCPYLIWDGKVGEYDYANLHSGFGFGGSGLIWDEYEGTGGAGGSGFIGGTGSLPPVGGSTKTKGGGGGAGYVYTADTSDVYPNDGTLSSKYYLTNAKTIGGNKSFNNINGTSVTGNSGNGAAKISGTGQVLISKFPKLMGLNDLTIEQGTSADLTEGVTLICENNKTGCSLVGTDITNTKSLSVGTYKITYTVKSASGSQFKYERNLNVVSSYSKYVLDKLGLSVSSGTPNFSDTSCTSLDCDESTVGIYSALDDLGTSYYFRGDVTNNYVSFAGIDWRIIRINGDGSVRLIYDGAQKCRNSAHCGSDIDTILNVSGGHNTHAGYMYGDMSADTYSETHSNLYSRNIKEYVDTWYKFAIAETSYSKYVADAIYCNDRSLVSGTGVGKEETSYGFHGRREEPTLKCAQQNDRFTVSSSLGNGKLTYPVGLITADEAVMAGSCRGYGCENDYFYLNNGDPYWTMTPAYYDEEDKYVTWYEVDAHGELVAYVYGAIGHGVRPVISLKPDAITGGTGTSSNPFTVG